jgi:hypothetical protein
MTVAGKEKEGEVRLARLLGEEVWMVESTRAEMVCMNGHLLQFFGQDSC